MPFFFKLTYVFRGILAVSKATSRIAPIFVFVYTKAMLAHILESITYHIISQYLTVLYVPKPLNLNVCDLMIKIYNKSEAI